MLRIKSILICLVLAVLVSGCSFRFIYNHLDWWTNWYLDDYITLNEQQQKIFDEEFERLHLWHRETQLPLYLKQLNDIKLLINSEMSPEQVSNNLDQLLQHWQNFLIAAEPKLQPLALGLSKSQKQQLLTALTENNQDNIDDYENLNDKDWHEERSDEQIDQLKSWFGKLSSEQKAQVTKMSKKYQQSFMTRMAYRQRWSNEFAQLLNGDLPEHQFKFEFYRLFVNGRSLRDEQLNEITENNSKVFAEIFVYMVSTISDKQRKRINKKLNKVIGDLEYLMAHD